MEVWLWYFPKRTLAFGYRRPNGFYVQEWGHHCPDLGFAVNNFELKIRLWSRK